MQIRIIPVTAFEQNSSLLICEETRRAALVDPGGEPDRLRAAVADADVVVEKILLTHGHFDHAGAAGRLARELGVPIEGPQQDDRFLLDTLPQWCAQFGFPAGERVEPTRWLEDGDEVRFGDQVLEVRHCPGHTPGHVILFHRGDRVAIVGDVIFKGSIGRTDFPRGDHPTLLASIRSRIWTLGDDVLLLPGHGPRTTVGEERRHNPFLQGAYG
ncbi:MAG: MBL fold metallo-hydrolase [Gammaproteobacteria bacterium]|nr:MBL fold metallo-hydrolase [Gammaproteobacteria bacterium]MCP5298710.1 MBL fold metallo-hydrolase [Chromatiaceae bacterium]